MYFIFSFFLGFHKKLCFYQFYFIFQWSIKFQQQNIKAWLSPSKNCLVILDCKPFKNDDKCFLFYLKSAFHSQDILVFVTIFRSCRKNGLIRKISLTSKFMSSQPGLQTIAIHILPNISQSKENQTLKFGQFIEYNKRNIFLQKLYQK